MEIYTDSRERDEKLAGLRLLMATLELAGAAAGEGSREELVVEWHFDGNVKNKTNYFCL
ncbi:MAG: hypothetical protein KKG76_12015 [Euryarchaeota archaeon]|nr:hypothetical protein [Euryarchaeota archaeon]